MKLKIVIVDLEIPPRVKRWGLRLGIPAVVLLGGAAVAYAGGLVTLVTWSQGQTLNASDLNANFAAVQTPPGTIVAYGGSESGDGGVDEAPSGWLYCNGAALSRSTYANLFAAITVHFGGGDGVTTFNLPDLRGQFLRGSDNGAGIDPGRALGSAQADELASHTHQITGESSPYGLGSLPVFTNVGGNGTPPYTTSATGGSETRPKNVAVNYIIKY
jgi:phage-related tail fiber protein